MGCGWAHRHQLPRHQGTATQRKHAPSHQSVAFGTRARALRACCFTFAHGCTAACVVRCLRVTFALLTWQGMGLAPLESDPSADPSFSPFWTPFGAPLAPPQEAQRAKVTLADNSTWEARLVGKLTALLFTD